jgi:hypothetical protein
MAELRRLAVLYYQRFAKENNSLARLAVESGGLVCVQCGKVYSGLLEDTAISRDAQEFILSHKHELTRHSAKIRRLHIQCRRRK